MDYAVFQTSLFFVGLLLLYILYDIWCFYRVHFPERFAESPALSLPPNMVIDGGIDQFHVHGHIPQCYPRYSPNFIPGVGIQLTDIIETLWIQMNDISTSTRGMSTAHRQEYLDDQMNDSNWNKLTRHGIKSLSIANNLTYISSTAALLVRKWSTACQGLGPARQALLDVTPDRNGRVVQEWKKMADTAARQRRNNIEVMDIYDIQVSKREQRNCPLPAYVYANSDLVPTRAEIQRELTLEENSARGIKGAAAWITFGLKIQAQQYVLMPH